MLNTELAAHLYLLLFLEGHQKPSKANSVYMIKTRGSSCNEVIEGLPWFLVFFLHSSEGAHLHNSGASYQREDADTGY